MDDIRSRYVLRFVPGRTADVYDWIADSTGAIAAVAVVLLIARFVPKR
jgi:VanZ family protein